MQGITPHTGIPDSREYSGYGIHSFVVQQRQTQTQQQLVYRSAVLVVT